MGGERKEVESERRETEEGERREKRLRGRWMGEKVRGEQREERERE